MLKVSRRDILASFASSALFIANPSFAAGCDIRRAKINGVSTKSYSCELGEGKALTTTFMRVSDVLADSAGRGPLPDGFSNYDEMVNGNFLVENDTLNTFNELLNNYSYSYEATGFSVNYQSNESGKRKTKRDYLENPPRFRTLGVWDEPNPDELPFFPLVTELERTKVNPVNPRFETYLRHASQSDFDNFEDKIDQYLSLWRDKTGESVDADIIDNFKLLRYIKAGSVEKFIPLFFSDIFTEGCGGTSGGAHYAPPALYVDIAVCRNDGVEPIRIDDFFGSMDNNKHLRAYSPATPENTSLFSWKPIVLQPNQSVVATQRLLFGALPQFDYESEQEIRSKRAVFGSTQLPKGVIVDGLDFPFDGRSHNALIVNSFYGKGSCPYLFSWCSMTQEWVKLGKVIADCIGSENAGTDERRFLGLRTRFKLLEREHEQTNISDLLLELEMTNGTTNELTLKSEEVILGIGQAHEFSFSLPANISTEDVIASTLKVSGYYEKYTDLHLQERRHALLSTI